MGVDVSVPEFANNRSGIDAKGWIGGAFPSAIEPWPNAVLANKAHHEADAAIAYFDEIQNYAGSKPWLWPSQAYLFFSDLHADTDAFLRSLVASGGVIKTGPADDEIELTSFGQNAVFVIGGDCFDKGPENLRLLRAVGALRQTGANVSLLVGNHDLRTYIGLASAEKTDPRHAHLFVRMGKKAVPLFKEVFDQYIAGGDESWRDYAAEDIRRNLFPSDQWYLDFPAAADGIIPEEKVAKETQRIAEKAFEFEQRCEQLGLTLGMVYASLKKARHLFLEPDGEFYWYFNEMKLAQRAGSFLMVHAGVDDQVAAVLRHGGVQALNEAYASEQREDMFRLYNGPLGNAFRTKYRDGDLPLSSAGLEDLHAAGIYAVIHGHRNLLSGQQITLRSGLLNFECDASVDATTRQIEGLSGPGGAVTIIQPDARVLGVSTDYPFVKEFRPTEFCQLTTII